MMRERSSSERMTSAAHRRQQPRCIWQHGHLRPQQPHRRPQRRDDDKHYRAARRRSGIAGHENSGIDGSSIDTRSFRSSASTPILYSSFVSLLG